MPEKNYSLSKAVRELLNGGILTGFEREVHYMLQREAEAPGNHKWLRTSNARDSGAPCANRTVYSPTNYFDFPYWRVD